MPALPLEYAGFAPESGESSGGPVSRSGDFRRDVSAIPRLIRALLGAAV
ncbi:hypothetical protein PSCLAVI8L_140022 [Pseudoclavibacter sp. 8L]|nr:hypothetical protein PSCLAVI8L_140022 [Pseudoclavibacter sp. 8L]